MRNGRGTEESYQQLIQLLGLKDVLDKKPGQVSGGYQHRVSLARALVPQPDVLMMDEPLSGIDTVQKVKMIPEFRKILKQLEVPGLFVTHDSEEAHLLADSFAAIINGQVYNMESAQEAFLSINGTAQTR